MSLPGCDCSIIIPTRNRATILAGTLGRLAELNQKHIETIVIDNGSSDQTPGLERDFPDICWIKLNHNLGCAARNVGAAAARGRVLLMLDDDSYPEPGVIEYLVQTMDENPKLGAIACRVLLNDSSSPHRHDAGGVPGIFFNCGGAIHRDAFLEVGGLPIDFEYYVEEYDLCCRLWQGGWRVEPHGDAVVWHGRVTKNRDNNNMLRLLVRNNLLLWQRYAPPAIRDELIDQTLERYHRVAMKENALRGYQLGVTQGIERIRQRPTSVNPLSIDQLENLLGLPTARRLLKRWIGQHSVTNIGVWGRGKGCEQIIDLCRQSGIRVHAVYDLKHEAPVWREVSLHGQSEFQANEVDGLVVGTLSPGLAEDEVAELGGRFPGLPVVRLTEWITAASPAGPGQERPETKRRGAQSDRHFAFS